MATDHWDLWRRAGSGDRHARERLIEINMPLACSLAIQYRHVCEPLEDLCQVAMLGLVKAVDRFQPDRGIAFASYAVPTILGELRRHFRDHVWNVRLPRALQERTMKLDSATAQLTDELGRFPTPGELGEHLGLSVEDVLEALEANHARRTLSLDAGGKRYRLNDTTATLVVRPFRDAEHRVDLEHADHLASDQAEAVRRAIEAAAK